jgi:O-antigen ligase
LARLTTANRIVGAAPFWLLCAFIVLTFAMGGGARSDIQSLAILRPAAALTLGYALWGLDIDAVRRFRFLCLFALLILLLVGAHLVPLPPALWGSLPGRDLVSDIDRVTGLGAVWRPLSLAPSQTWNALFSLVIPLAAFLLLLRQTRDQRFDLVPLLLILGFFSALLGLLQAIGPTNGPLYAYNITNGSAAVGLFANRNHQAVFLACLFPLLAVYASTGAASVEQARFRRLIALAGALLLVPLLLVTGSRTGLIVGIVGLIAAARLYQAPEISVAPKRKIYRLNPLYVFGGAGVFILGAITILMSRAQALDRLLAGDSGETARLNLWEPVLGMTGAYFPFGSGIGSFVEAYQIDESFRALSPEYLNHAHNDWLEIAMTGGLPAILLAGLALAAWVWQGKRLIGESQGSRRGLLHARLGAILMLILALGSIADYPLRVPSLAVLFVIAAVWMADAFTQGQRTATSVKTS